LAVVEQAAEWSQWTAWNCQWLNDGRTAPIMSKNPGKWAHPAGNVAAHV